MSNDVVPRYRTRGRYDSSPTTPFYRQWGTCSETSWTLQSNDSCLVTPGSFETMSDIVVPGFNRRKGRGETFFNPMTKTVRSCFIDSPGLGEQYESTAVGITCSGLDHKKSYRTDAYRFGRMVMLSQGLSGGGLLPYSSIISDSDMTALKVEVSTKCAAGRVTSSSNLFESLAEIRQTLSLMRQPFRSVNNLLSKAESFRRRGLSAASGWLTFRYGVMPVIRDVETVLSGLKKSVGNKRVTARSQGHIDRTSSSSVSYVNGAGVGLVYGITNTDTISIRAMSLDEYYVNLAENLGFTFKGLVTLPWELIPYSFVVDWFANIGDFLNAIVPLPGVKQLGSALVTDRLTKSVYTPLSTTAPANHTLQRSVSGKLSSSFRSVTRGSVLQPDVVIRSDFRLDSATRLADSAALIAQRIDRLFRH